MKLHAALLSLLLVVPFTVHAQESPSPEPTDENDSDAAIELLVDQEIADQDLESDVEAEVLPTDGFRFVLENALFRIQSAFTFQAERKAALLQERLHRLDRKLTACADIGDEECVARIEDMINSAEVRTHDYLERKADVLGHIEESFEEWRTRRQEHIMDAKERLEENAEHRDELFEELKAKREEAIQSRIEHLEELHNMREDIREKLKDRFEQQQEDFETRFEDKQEAIQNRIQNREELIEARSEALKEKLDAARDRVEEHQDEIDDAQDGSEDDDSEDESDS